eukprot:2549436-Amphidinium_carterae.1
MMCCSFPAGIRAGSWGTVAPRRVHQAHFVVSYVCSCLVYSSARFLNPGMSCTQGRNQLSPAQLGGENAASGSERFF